MTRPYFDPVLSGRKMRSIRKSRNISVEQVRDYMGFESVQSIYKWERGECFPQADTLIALSLLYQVNPVELFEEDAKASSFNFDAYKLRAQSEWQAVFYLSYWIILYFCYYIDRDIHRVSEKTEFAGRC